MDVYPARQVAQMNTQGPVEWEAVQKQSTAPVLWALTVLLAFHLGPLLAQSLTAPGAVMLVVWTVIWVLASAGGPLFFRHRFPRAASFTIRPWAKFPRDIIATVALSIVMLGWFMVSTWVIRMAGFEGARSYAPWDMSFAPDFIRSIIAFWRPVIFCPIVEEIFWRAYSLRQLEKLLSKRQALLLASFLFAVCHFQTPAYTLSLFGYGLILGGWRQKMGTLMPPMLAHMILNAFLTYPWCTGPGPS